MDAAAISSSLKPSITFPANKKALVTARKKRDTIQFSDQYPNSKSTDIARGEVTWQIIVGAIAGVTPFVVAGIEFSKRIIAQRRCQECGGSGLVLIDKDYCRCPGCGGFLPWQTWKRFFSGYKTERKILPADQTYQKVESCQL
ncbi:TRANSMEMBRANE PROTEIN [Salix purpurea]|uniref:TRANSMEMBRANE PROTEIN n=1 Tax=Salix purpurea TaxID=77065 RepID=A0A9Q0PBY9_SALPP|nr:TRANSMEMBRANE PROTEIN [Salix purpurea]